MRRKRNHRVLFAICSISKASPDILFCEVWIIIHDLLPTHSGGDPTEHIANCDAQTSDAGLSTPLACFDGNDFSIVHGWRAD